MFLRVPRTPRRPAARPVSFRPSLEALEDRSLLSAGALDTTFGGTGVVTTSLSKSSDTATTSLLQPNGDLVTAGITVSGPHKTPAFALVAHTPTGSLDTTFGSRGEAITPVGSNLDPRAAAAQYASTDTTGNANKIVVMDNYSGGIALARYNANGTLDTAFGTGGLVTTAVNGLAFSVAIQPADGKIVVGGLYNGAWLLRRYNANGSLDTTFGSNGNGEVITYLPPGDDRIESVVVQPDGKIVAGGRADYAPSPYGTTQTYPEFTLVRYNSDGSLDSTFGSGGIVHTLWPGTGGGAGDIHALALQGNGQIVAVGAA